MDQKEAMHVRKPVWSCLEFHPRGHFAGIDRWMPVECRTSKEPTRI
jgi:hypothetical protein